MEDLRNSLQTMICFEVMQFKTEESFIQDTIPFIHLSLKFYMYLWP